jgi:recombination protein RecA
MSKAQEIKEQLNAKLHRKYKDKAPVIMMGSELPPVEWITTGMLAYDWVNGGGGPRSHIEQLWGRRSSGKTTLALRRIAEAQRMGLCCAYLDAEHTLDKFWATKMGVNLSDLLLFEPDLTDSAEVICDLMVEILLRGDIDFLVVDSVPALCPQAKIDKPMEEKHYAGVAGILSQFFDKIIGPGILYNSNTVVIFINQPREVIGSRIPQERLPGGRALSHYSSIINKTLKGDYITIGSRENEEKIGQEIKIINEKNKVGWPFKEATVRLHFASGVNPLWDVLHFAKKYDIVELRGSWMYYKEEQMGNGIEEHMKWLMSHPDIYKEMKTTIINMIRSGK